MWLPVICITIYNFIQSCEHMEDNIILKVSTNDDVVKNPRKLVELSPVIREWESGVSRRGHGQTRSMGQLSEDTPSIGVHSLLSCMMEEMWNIFEDINMVYTVFYIHKFKVSD